MPHSKIALCHCPRYTSRISLLHFSRHRTLAWHTFPHLALLPRFHSAPAYSNYGPRAATATVSYTPQRWGARVRASQAPLGRPASFPSSHFPGVRVCSPLPLRLAGNPSTSRLWGLEHNIFRCAPAIPVPARLCNHSQNSFTSIQTPHPFHRPPAISLPITSVRHQWF